MKVILVAALTVDGKIGVDSDHFPDWTESADKKMFKQISKASGVIIMGSRTYDTLGTPLPGRKHVVMTRKTHRLARGEQVVFTDKSPAEILAELEGEGYNSVILGGGSRINYVFAKAGLIDEVLVTFSPIVFGAGLSLFSNEIRMNLSLAETGRLGENSLVARYRVLR